MVWISEKSESMILSNQHMHFKDETKFSLYALMNSTQATNSPIDFGAMQDRFKQVSCPEDEITLY